MGIDVWLGVIESKALYESYLEERFGDENGPVNAFASDQGETFVDHDFFESVYFDKLVTPTKALRALSITPSKGDFTPGNLPAKCNCIFADHERQFGSPVSVSKPGIEIFYLGRLDQAETLSESTALPREVTLKFVSTPLIVAGMALDSVTINRERPCTIGGGSEAFIDLTNQVPGIAPVQVEIAYSPEKEFWEIFDRGANGLTRYSGEEFDGARAAPWPGIRFSIGDFEIEWS